MVSIWSIYINMINVTSHIMIKYQPWQYDQWPITQIGFMKNHGNIENLHSNLGINIHQYSESPITSTSMIMFSTLPLQCSFNYNIITTPLDSYEYTRKALLKVPLWRYPQTVLLFWFSLILFSACKFPPKNIWPYKHINFYKE